MNYSKLKQQWAIRRAKVKAMIDKGIPRRLVAERLGITKQRLSQIERSK